jgi:large subunit ribosomal protein L29
MAADNFRQIDDKELKIQLTQNEEQIFRLRFQIRMGQTDGVKKYRQLKRDRARILGVLRERELKTERELKSAGKGK